MITKNLIPLTICIILISLTIAITGCTSAPYLGPTPTPTVAPVYTPLPNIIAIAGGGSHGLAIQNGGAVYAWGHNDYGQLGLGDNTFRYGAKQISGLSSITAIAGGLQHSLAVSGGAVYAWGRNNGGQLGNNSNTDSNIPVLLTFPATVPTTITVVAAGNQHSLALDNTGNVWVWGANIYGQLGTDDNVESKTPVKNGLTNVIAIAANGDHSLALKNDYTLWAWGRNDYGQLGNNSKSNSNTPVQVGGTGFINVTTIAAGWNHNVVLKGDGTIWTWGWNGYGQLGTGDYSERLSPIQITTGITNISAGWHYCIASLTGAVKVWGENTKGYLGVSPTPYCNTPTNITDLNSVTINAIAGGGACCIVLRNDGTVWTWGSSATGNPTHPSSMTPVQVFYQTN